MSQDGVLLLRSLDSRLTKDLPSDLQKLRCKVRKNITSALLLFLKFLFFLCCEVSLFLGGKKKEEGANIQRKCPSVGIFSFTIVSSKFWNISNLQAVLPSPVLGFHFRKQIPDCSFTINKQTDTNVKAWFFTRSHKLVHFLTLQAPFTWSHKLVKFLHSKLVRTISQISEVVFCLHSELFHLISQISQVFWHTGQAFFHMYEWSHKSEGLFWHSVNCNCRLHSTHSDLQHRSRSWVTN